MAQGSTGYGKRPSVRRSNGPKVNITREDVHRAMERFRAEGGLINTLPPQTSGRRRSAGASIDTGFEPVSEG